MGESMVSLISIDISGLELLWCLLWTCTKTAYHEGIAAGLDFEWTYAVRSVGGCDSNSNRMLRSTTSFHLEVHY